MGSSGTASSLRAGGGGDGEQSDPCWLHLSGAGHVLKTFQNILQQWQVISEAERC